MTHYWIGTARRENGALEWQVSNGPVGKPGDPFSATRSESTDFFDVNEALAFACRPGNTVVFEDDFVAPAAPENKQPVHVDLAIEALQSLCTTIANTGGVIDLDGEQVPSADPDWVDLGTAYMTACEALGIEPVIKEHTT